MRRYRYYLVIIIVLAFSTLVSAQEAKPKNVILFISDGTGFNHLKMTSLWKHGAAGHLSFQNFPVRLSMTTVPSNVAPYDPRHIWLDPFALILDPTDSAAAATAIATGHKAKNSVISVAPNGEAYLTAMEQAAADGKSVGVVTSSGFYDATPAAFLAHAESRREYKNIVSEMLFRSPARVILGAGDLRYNADGLYEEYESGLKRIGGLQVWMDMLSAAVQGRTPMQQAFEPWALIQRVDDFRALRAGDTAPRVLGVAHSYITLNAERSGHDEYTADDEPYEVPRLANLPTLADLALGAINVVDDDEDGFFLMIETEGIDETAHAWRAGRMIEEILDLDAAVAAVMQWVESNSSWDETLLIVTADHETGLLTGPTVAGIWSEIMPVAAGEIAPHQWGTPGHSNLPVPLYAVGVGASSLVELADEKDPRFGACLRNDELGRFLLRIFGANVDAMNLEE